MRRSLYVCLFVPALLLAQGSTQNSGASAKADLRDAKGKSVGTATLVETPRGVLVRINAQGLPPGEHGFHLHQTGKCDAPDFKTAGGHFNPTGKNHGFYSANGQHAGDLANMVVESNGEATTERYVEDLRIKGGNEALLDSDGAAVVIHAGKDDYRSDPAGDAGGRIACGVIKAQ